MTSELNETSNLTLTIYYNRLLNTILPSVTLNWFRSIYKENHTSNYNNIVCNIGINTTNVKINHHSFGHDTT